jgi:O-antigen ligase
VAAAGFAAALLLAMYAKHLVPRWLTLAATAVSFYGVLAIDSRGALLFALALVGIFAVWRRANLAWIAFVIPLSPLVILGGLQALAETGLASGVSRANEDLGSGNNRLYIWEPIWNFVHQPTAELLYGFGAKGHITSGVSANYAYLFSGSDADPYAYSSHNVALQTLLDSGYIGLAVLVAMLFVSLRALRGIDHPIAMALSAITLVVFLSGMTEALPNVVFLDTMVLTLMVTGVALGYRRPVMVEESAPSWASSSRVQLGDRVAAEGA